MVGFFFCGYFVRLHLILRMILRVIVWGLEGSETLDFAYKDIPTNVFVRMG